MKFFFIVFQLISLLIVGLSHQTFGEEKRNLLTFRGTTYNKYTRLVYEFNMPVSYEVIEELSANKILLVLNNVAVNNNFIEGHFSDNRVINITPVRQTDDTVTMEINLSKKDITIFNMAMDTPPSVVIDIKDITKQSEGEEKIIKQHNGLPTIAVKEKDRKGYEEILKRFQHGKYEDTINLINEFIVKFPESKFLPILYPLLGDCKYNIINLVSRKDNHPPNLLEAIDLYKEAMRRFPNSKEVPRILFMIARSYQDMMFFVEATTIYKNLINNFPEDKFVPWAELNTGIILIETKKFVEGYREMLDIINTYGTSPVAREATFISAESLYQNKNFSAAQKLYEEGMNKWPVYLEIRPEVRINIADTYIKNSLYEKGREQLFHIINMYQEPEIVSKALINIGDAYRLEGRLKDSLKVFVELIARNKAKGDEDIGRLNMADMGVKDSNIKVDDLIFDYNPYLYPLKTYDQIVNKLPAGPITEEALFKKGVALSNSNKYVEAILTLKRLLEKYPSSPFANKGETYLRDIFFQMVNSYYTQDGFFPILITYRENIDTFLKEIIDSSILLKIGDSYKNIGLYHDAIIILNKISKIDSKGYYEESITFRKGEVYLLSREYEKAIDILLSLIKRFPKSSYISPAYNLLGMAYYKKGDYNNSIINHKKYLSLLDKSEQATEIYYYMGNSYFKLGDYKNAEAYYRDAITSFNKLAKDKKEIPDYIIESYYYRGDSLFLMENYKDAIAILEDAIKNFPNNPNNKWASYIIASCYEYIKKGEDAIKMLANITAKEEFLGRLSDAYSKEIKWEIENMEKVVVTNK